VLIALPRSEQMSNNDVKTLRNTRTQGQDHMGIWGHTETSVRQAEVFKQCSKLPVATTSYFGLQARSLSGFWFRQASRPAHQAKELRPNTVRPIRRSGQLHRVARSPSTNPYSILEDTGYDTNVYIWLRRPQLTRRKPSMVP
jgi:hypothetical protein